MCDPITLGIIGIATAVGGTAFGAVSAHEQGVAAQKTANYNAQVDEQQATEAEKTGNVQEQQQMLRTRQIIASQRAGMGASGAVVDSGSFGDVLDTTNFMGATDAATIRANAAKQAWGYRQDATMTRLQGAQAKTASNYAVTGSLLTGATKTFGMMAANKDASGSYWKA